MPSEISPIRVLLPAVITGCLGYTALSVTDYLVNLAPWVRMLVGGAGVAAGTVLIVWYDRRAATHDAARRARAETDRAEREARAASDAEAQLMTPEARVLLGHMLATQRELWRSEGGRRPLILISPSDAIDHKSAGGAEGYLRWQQGLENLVQLGAVRERVEQLRYTYTLAPRAPEMAQKYPQPERLAFPLTPYRHRDMSLSELQEAKRQQRNMGS